MIPTGWLQIPYALLFAALTLASLVRLARGQGLLTRISTVFEVLMGTAMLLMVFNWGVSRAVSFQVVVFGLGAAWYLARALGLDDRFPAASADAHTHGPIHLGYHALLMLAMIWMLVVMIPHGRPETGHFAMVGLGQPAGFVSGVVLSMVLLFGSVLLVVRGLRASRPSLSTLYDIGMSFGMLAMTAPMIHW